MIYLDYAATSPMRREAVEAYIEAASQAFGNTQSLHDHGTKAAHYVNSCKAVFGELLNARADGFYFTGNASEGNQLAIRSILRGRPKSCNVIITTYLEHASVLTTMHELEKEGYVVRYAPVNEYGVADIAWIANEVNDKTALIVLQMVNSEIGAIHPVKECVEAVNTYGVPVHCDMVQAFGKLPIDLAALGITSAVISPHKFGGPKGVGVVYVNPSVHWESFVEGTTHQSGFRAGTMDVPAIVASTIAAKLAIAEQTVAYDNALALEQYLTTNLNSTIHIVGKPRHKSPFIQGIILPHIEGQWMMLECNRHQIAISTGTACKIGHGEAISAIKALGFESDAARRFVRISFNGSTKFEEIDEFVRIVNNSNFKTPTFR